jgi:hypothetical protein
MQIAMEAIGIEATATSSVMEIDEMKASEETEEEWQHVVGIKKTKLDMINSQSDLQLILVQFKRRISGAILVLVLVERDGLGLVYVNDRASPTKVGGFQW